MKKTLLAAVAAALFAVVPVTAQEKATPEAQEPVTEAAPQVAPAEPAQPPKGEHQFDSKGPWCVAGGVDFFSAVYDPATGGWAWAPGLKVFFFHLTPPHKETSVRLLGAAVKLALFDGRLTEDGRGWVPIITLVPISVGRVSFEFTPYRVSRPYDEDYTGPRKKGSVLFLVSYAF